MRAAVRILTLALLLTTTAPAITVKVLSIDTEQKTITLLLPMHSTRIRARLAFDERNIRLELGHFYQAEFVGGEVGTIKRNWLEIKPDKGPAVRFRLQRIEFLD